MLYDRVDAFKPLLWNIGGMDLAAEWAGFKTVGQCEFADYPTKVLEKHWPDVPRWRDIHELSADEFIRRTGRKSATVISGGFPCQPHSLSGKRKASDDERDLWGELYRVICEIKPRWIVAENVRGLLSSEDGRFFGRVLRDLARLGGGTWWYCFPSAATGTLFQGDRVAIVSTTNSVGRLRMDTDKEIRPNANYLEMLEEWGTRQNHLLSSMERPNTLPECRHHRNDDGLPEQVDRLKCLGNAVVPQQFYPIFKMIAEIEKGLT